MALRLDGKEVAKSVRAQLKEQVDKLVQAGKRLPCLAVILVNDDPASHTYVRNKIKGCAEVGMLSRKVELPLDCSEEKLLAVIGELNHDETVDGILCQLPLPSHLDEKTVVQAIDPRKDVDGFHPQNAGELYLGLNPELKPCTPAGVLEILRYYGYEFSGKHAVMIGRSNIVGKPVAQMLLAENCTVTMAHSRTVNLPELAKTADLLISAVGKPNFITPEFTHEQQWIVDVAINRNEQGKLCGDVMYEAVEPKVAALTPVPGGVGPMTITMLLKNTYAAYQAREKLHD